MAASYKAGVGFPLLALLIFGVGLHPVAENFVKAGLTWAYSCLVLVVFAWAGQVQWTEGTVLAAGSMLGAWLGSHWQVRSGAAVVRWFW